MSHNKEMWFYFVCFKTLLHILFSFFLLSPDNISAQIFSLHTRNLYVFTIEETHYYRFNFIRFVAPYPSITKFQLQYGQDEYNYPINDNRPIDLFFTGNTRKWNVYRKFIFENVNIKTNLSYNEFFRTYYKNYTKYNNVGANKNKTLSVIYHFGKLKSPFDF
jgi:hypothetical protein